MQCCRDTAPTREFSMGWLFGWHSRKELVDRLTHGNGVKTLKSCSVGTNLWCVHEGIRQDGTVVRFAALYLIRGPAYGRSIGDRFPWGYKDLNESEGPDDASFPASWLALLTPTDSQYALAWRERVRVRGTKLASAVAGSRWVMRDGRVFEIVKRASPTSWQIRLQHGGIYRVGTNVLLASSPLASPAVEDAPARSAHPFVAAPAQQELGL
jgi:hypothetical protein